MILVYIYFKLLPNQFVFTSGSKLYKTNEKLQRGGGWSSRGTQVLHASESQRWSYATDTRISSAGGRSRAEATVATPANDGKQLSRRVNLPRIANAKYLRK